MSLLVDLLMLYLVIAAAGGFVTYFYILSDRKPFLHFLQSQRDKGVSEEEFLIFEKALESRLFRALLAAIAGLCWPKMFSS